MRTEKSGWNNRFAIQKGMDIEMTQEKLVELLNDLSLDEKINQLFQGNGSFLQIKELLPDRRQTKDFQNWQ